MEAHDFPLLHAEEFPGVPFVIDGISSRFVKENRVIPLDVRENKLWVVMANPHDTQVVDALRVVSGTDVVVCSGEGPAIDEYIAKFYGQGAQNIDRIMEDMNGSGLETIRDEEDEDVGHLKDLASEAPIITLVNLLITRAVETRASDIHIEPFQDEVRVRYRIDGVLHEVQSAPKRLEKAMISRLKIMAKLNIAERRLPQDGRIRLRAAEREIDLRVSTIPILHGESVVMRVLDKEATVIDLPSLGFFPETLDTFNEIIRKPDGIFLVTGPTGSGKTTTLYGALDTINTPDKKIITVEDPVEYQIKGVNQIQVKSQIGLSFASMLRHIVRQDPDVIMIGEIRDLETAQIAIQASLTGHLVFSTLHTNDAPGAVTRLLDMGVEAFLLASTVRGILAQRLVRILCPECSQPQPDGSVRGTGCEKCAHTGYHGRSGIFELLVVDDAIRKLILANADATQIRNAARAHGMATLREDGTRKAGSGITTLAEVLRVT
jgi:general secretion pathway protein E